MKVDGSLKSLIQGVSQQPPRSRLPGQCTEQINMSSNPVDGLTRRPPLDDIAALFDSSDNPQFYYTDHGADKKFILVALDDEIKAFDLEGNEKTVNEVGDAFDYLSGDPLVFATLENQTIIANTATTCSMLTNPATDYADFIDYGSIVYIAGGQYGRTYKVEITYNATTPTGTPTTATFTHATPDGSNVSHGAQIATDYIATQLASAISVSGMSVTRVNDVLYIQWNNGRTDRFTVTVGDGMGNVNIRAVNNQVTQVGQLPRFAPHGYHVTVSGDGNSGTDDWYLVFSVTPDGTGTPATGAGFGRAGVWVETVKNKTFYLMDDDTMPHVLTYDPDTDEFTFEAGTWDGRQVGDEDSNEDPSFIGNTITDMGYFQGRLVFLSGPAVVMSRTNKPFDFWIETATGQTDTDAIDVQSTAKGVSRMLRCVPFNRDLIVFADSAQFIIFGRNSLTPTNSSLVLTSSFESNMTAPPVPAGRNVFFAINYGNFTGVREFFTDGSQDINDSRPITQHILKYMPGRIRLLASTSNFDTLLVQTLTDKKKLYAYEYIWVDNEKLQSSWSAWTLPEDVDYFFFVESIIYLVYNIGENYYLGKIDLDTQSDPGLDYQVKLDRKVIVEEIDLEIEDLYADMPDIDDIMFVQGEGCPHPGMRVLVDEYDEINNVITLKEDMEGGNVIAGVRYRSSYKPTMPFVKDADGQKVTTGKLVISKFDVSTKDTGIMEATKTSPYTDDVTLRFIGRIVGNPNTVVGQPAITSEIHTVPIRDNADYSEVEFFTNEYMPLTMLDIEWIGQYTKRGRRITGGGA